MKAGVKCFHLSPPFLCVRVLCPCCCLKGQSHTRYCCITKEEGEGCTQTPHPRMQRQVELVLYLSICLFVCLSRSLNASPLSLCSLISRLILIEHLSFYPSFFFFFFSSFTLTMSSDTQFAKKYLSKYSISIALAMAVTASALFALFAFYPRVQYEQGHSVHSVNIRSKRSPLVSSSSSFMEGSTGAANLFMINRFTEMNHEDNSINEITHEVNKCRKRSLPMCSGQVPFNSTVYPNFIGDSNELEASRSLPYFNYIAKSRCNRRIKQLLCAFLEPDCSNGRPLPPCKKFCRIALEGCAEFIPQTLELSSAFDCRRYPDSTDPRVCVNLAMGPKCAADEFQCPDRSCIPRHWVCDGVRDCIFAADEANCNTVGE